ncbi:hypothetical protein BZA77DRAFT_292610 [Pyronema omphalodes]|nr:hypothetical protein BZA77DRAFT_292610 [Pyronema omphalodes]
MAGTFTIYAEDNHENHLKLLSINRASDGLNSAWKESIKTTPVFTAAAGKAVDLHEGLPGYQEFGLLGQQLEVIDPVQCAIETTPVDEDGRVFLNGDAPLSAFICGVQGAGKSNSLAVMLENFLLSNPAINSLPVPLTGLVFHYDRHAPTACEAAYLCSDLPVTVLVPPSSLRSATALYSSLPGAPANLKIRSLRLRELDLNITRMLSLMAVDQSNDNPPLYLEIVRKILRFMANSDSGFRYSVFKTMLGNEKLSPGQKGPLNLRLEILESFMEGRAPSEKAGDLWGQEGGLVIVDLSDPFVDEATACLLFEICMNLFLERHVKGSVIALDEAHKYMTATPSALKFTDTLLSNIRQQRHIGARIIIATQEPTISPKLLDLCSFTLVHRFTSPEWLTFLKNHIAAAGQAQDRAELMKRIVELDCGEAFLFVPAGIMVRKQQIKEEENSPILGEIKNIFGMKNFTKEMEETPEEKKEMGVLEKLGMRYLKIKIRKRVTEDGGRSVMAVAEVKKEGA